MPLSCDGGSPLSCALAAPCTTLGSQSVRSVYERSVDYWRDVSSTARWSERLRPNPYKVHESLSERGIECEDRIGERKLPQLTLSNGNDSGVKLASRRSSPHALVAELAAVGLKRVVLVGDSLMRYVFAAIVGAYCGSPLDRACNLTSYGLPAHAKRALHVDGTTVAYVADNTAKGADAINQLIFQGTRPAETHVVYRLTAWYNELKMPGFDTAARTQRLRHDAEGFFERLFSHGIGGASLMSPTPCGYAGQVEYNPLGDRNDGPAHTVLLHKLACGLGLPVVDLWPLEITCATQGRQPNHMNVHNCAPGIPDIEWQLLLRYLKNDTWRSVSRAQNTTDHCHCPHVDLLTCGDQQRYCAVDAAKERTARTQVVTAMARNPGLVTGIEHRSIAQLSALCASGQCEDIAAVLHDPQLVTAGPANSLHPHSPALSADRRSR